MKIQDLIPLRSIVIDTVTKLEGMLVSFQYELGDQKYYLFQPRGLNPKTGAPVETFWIVDARINWNGRRLTVDLPIETLGTKAADAASGFSGTVIALTLHSSGCVHLHVKPAGTIVETAGSIESCNFDIRRLTGPAIPKLSEDEIALDQARKPSPGPVASSPHRM